MRVESNSENQITRVYDGAANYNYPTEFSYHPSGAIASYRAGSNVVHATTFDANRYWARSITAGALQLSYDDYDNVGNLRQLGDSRGGYGQTFTYDVLDRLTGAVGVYGTITYAYDAHGNRQSAGGTTYQYDPATLRLMNQGGSAFTYFSNGNLQTAFNTTYAYSPRNLLQSATIGTATTTYAYDADDWRVKKATGTSNTYLRGLNGELLCEWKDPGTATTTVRDYIYAGPRLLAVVKR